MCFRKAIVVVASCAFALGIGAGQSQAQTSSAVSLKDAQTTLKELGYYKGAVDGVYGPLTQRALEQYQREHDLKASGRLDSATAARLHGGSASSPIQQGENEVKAGAGEAKRSVSVRTDEPDAADSDKPAATASDKPKGSTDDVKESAKEGADATKEGAKEAGDAAKGAGDEIKGVFGGGDSDKDKKKKQKTE